MRPEHNTKTIRRVTLRFFLAAAAVWMALGSGTVFAQTKWVESWYTSAEPVVLSTDLPPSPGLPNNSSRTLVQVSIGGDTLRMKFSNEYSTAATTMKAVTIAVAKGPATIDTTTLKNLLFNGKDSITMAESTTVTSDPLAFNLTPRMSLEVTIYYGQAPTSNVTGHRGSRATTYIVTGNQSTARVLAATDTISRWYNINEIDVRAPDSAAAVSILGNSLTDGKNSITDSNDRWPDIFSEALLANQATSQVAVANAGIGAGCMLPNCGISTPGIQRFQRDLLNPPGVKWDIVLLGVNDIGGVTTSSGATTTANNLINAYETIIDSAHGRGYKIYGATIMPFGGYSAYYNQYSESCRSMVNAWIRNSGKYDAVIDFDHLMRSPTDTFDLGVPSPDGLHPTEPGYVTMGKYVSLSLFTQSSLTSVKAAVEPQGYSVGETATGGPNGGLTFQFQIPRETLVSLKVYSVRGDEVAELAGKTFSAGQHAVNFKTDGLAKGVYLYSFKADNFSVTRKLILSNP